VIFQLACDGLFDVLGALPHHALNQWRSYIAGHHNHRIFKINRSALPVSEPSII
jgi:hypothetical protein